MTRIHERAGPASLGLLRIILFGTWAVIPTLERFPLLADLPQRSFVPAGPFAFIPDSLLDVVVSSSGLWVVSAVVVAGSVVVAIGLFPHRWIAISVALLVLLEQGLVRGFSGHINHAELALAYGTLVVAVFPIFDSLSVVKPKSEAPRDLVMYRAPFLLCMLVLTISFSFTGAARLSEGVQLFGSDTLRNLLGERWLMDVALDDGITRAVPWYLDTMWVGISRITFAVTTLLELLSPLALLTRPTRIGFVVFAVAFHLANLILLGVTFFENTVLLLAFSERWFHDIASRLAHLPKRDTGSVTASQ